jgi:hypothetical protein
LAAALNARGWQTSTASGVFTITGYAPPAAPAPQPTQAPQPGTPQPPAQRPGAQPQRPAAEPPTPILTNSQGA